MAKLTAQPDIDPSTTILENSPLSLLDQCLRFVELLIGLVDLVIDYRGCDGALVWLLFDDSRRSLNANVVKVEASRLRRCVLLSEFILLQALPSRVRLLSTLAPWGASNVRIKPLQPHIAPSLSCVFFERRDRFACLLGPCMRRPWSHVETVAPKLDIVDRLQLPLRVSALSN